MSTFCSSVITKAGTNSVVRDDTAGLRCPSMIQLSNITQHILSVTAAGPSVWQSSLPAFGVGVQLVKALTETDRRVTFAARARLLSRPQNDAMLLKTGDGTKHPPMCSTGCFDLGWMPPAELAADGWPDWAVVIRALRAGAALSTSTTVAAVRPSVRHFVQLTTPCIFYGVLPPPSIMFGPRRWPAHVHCGKMIAIK